VRHSYDVGDSTLTGSRLCPTEATAKKVAEPGLAFLAGLLLADHCKPLAALLLVGSVSLWAVAYWIEWRDRSELESLVDASIEQEVIARKFQQARERR
jgi:hypothetical protein